MAWRTTSLPRNENERVDMPPETLEPGHRRLSPRGLRLGRDQVQERGHGRNSVEEVGVHVHVQHVRAGADLVESYLDGCLIVARLDESSELGRTRDVLAAIEEI